MNKWVIVGVAEYVDGLTVHEVKCPACGYRETFHTVPPSSCYLCGLNLEYDDGCKCGSCKWMGLPTRCEPCRSCGRSSEWCRYEPKFEPKTNERKFDDVWKSKKRKLDSIMARWLIRTKNRRMNKDIHLGNRRNLSKN